jgi:serine/threonine protein kinase
MWSVGCTLAEIVLGCKVFAGEKEHEVLSSIIDLLGCPPEVLTTTPGLACLDRLAHAERLLGSSLQIPPTKLSRSLAQRASSKDRTMPAGLAALLRGLLEYDPARRWSAQEARQHWWFTDRRAECATPEQIASACKPVMQRASDPDATLTRHAQLLIDVAHLINTVVNEQLDMFALTYARVQVNAASSSTTQVTATQVTQTTGAVQDEATTTRPPEYAVVTRSSSSTPTSPQTSVSSTLAAALAYQERVVYSIQRRKFMAALSACLLPWDGIRRMCARQALVANQVNLDQANQADQDAHKLRSKEEDASRRNLKDARDVKRARV